MEHSILHAVQLTGLIAAFGGCIFVLGFLLPASPSIQSEDSDELVAKILNLTAHSAAIAALAGGAGALIDLFVQVAELQGKTVFAGFNFVLTFQYATQTIVGRTAFARASLLVIAAVLLRGNRITKWWFAGLCTAFAVICASLVSHAAAVPISRAPALISQVMHITAGAAWLGVLFHIFLARAAILNHGAPSTTALVAELIRRFSPIALGAGGLLGLSGLYSVYRFVGSGSSIATSAYGLTLIVKLLLVAVVTYAGFVNYKRIRPALVHADDQTLQTVQSLLTRFIKMVELEVTAGVLVIAVAGILGSVPPPGPEGAARLTRQQFDALLSPDLPTTKIVDPSTFYGATDRTLDDLRYSEFTHNWSGVAVALLGLAWLFQSLGGKSGRRASIFWPLLLIPFAIFIAIAADPEVWILRKVTLFQAFSDPQLLEHQLGALMVLFLVWLGWRDRRVHSEQRPLGYALPLLMIAGSLMLLGHAHSTLSATEELTNLVNVQHAIFGAFGLSAGTIRWCNLRGLFPNRFARLLWPSLVFGLGLFMAFFYREVV
jgi:putative copper resistance protein D